MPSTINSLLAQARAALISDPAGAAVMLEEAAERLRGHATPLQADAIRSELAAISKLARNGEHMWRAWGRLLGLEPGYTSGGALAAEPGASHIVVEG